MTRKVTKLKGQFLAKFFHWQYDVSYVADDNDNLLASTNRNGNNLESSQETPTAEASSGFWHSNTAAMPNKAEMNTCQTNSLLDSNKSKALNQRPTSYGWL